MQRWQLTVGLFSAALLAALVAPRLAAAPPMSPPTPQIPSRVAERPTPPPGLPIGHVEVTARLDRAAILADATSERFLTITVGAVATRGPMIRRPIDLAVVMDVSGSMSANGKMDHAKRAAKRLVSEMHPEDTYALVTFEDDATTVIPPTQVLDPGLLHRAIDQIYEGGGTNLYAGLDRGAREIRRGLEDDAVGRVVVLSDGHANVGTIEPDALARLASEWAADGVTVSTIGLGLDFNEDLLATLSDVAGGTYAFVDDPNELETVFAAELNRSVSLVARRTAVHITLPAGVDGLEVIGWDAERHAQGWTVWLGDVYAGETRKIVARVRVDGGDSGSVEVADVRAEYHDLIEGRMSASTATAAAQVTTDPERLGASMNRDAAAEASRAWGTWHLDQSARAYAEGNVEESKRLISEGRKVLESAARQLAMPSLAEDAEALRNLGDVVETYDPSSIEGKRAIKGGKEMFRGRAR